uniref:Uncharacterized protein n=1 Tax=Mus spicilegus TaxID=10103 RepID=A0A8C6GUF1_MUSSI
VGEKQDAGRDVQIRDDFDRTQKECGDAQEAPSYPDEQAGRLGSPSPPVPPAGHGVYQQPVAVLTDGHHQEDADEQVGLDDPADHPAEVTSKGPVETVPNILCPEGQAQHKHQIRSCQVSQVDFCYAVLVQEEHAEDKEVLQCGQQEEDPEEGGLDGIEPTPPLGVWAVVLRKGPVKSRPEDLCGDVEHFDAERK